MARRAAIAGNQAWRGWPPGAPRNWQGMTVPDRRWLASFLRGAGCLPSADVFFGRRSPRSDPDEKLSPRDRALRDGGQGRCRCVGPATIGRKPGASTRAYSERPAGEPKRAGCGGKRKRHESLRQPFEGSPTGQRDAGRGRDGEADIAAPGDPVLEGFLASGRSQDRRIDALLKRKDNEAS